MYYNFDIFFDPHIHQPWGCDVFYRVGAHADRVFFFLVL